MMGVSSIKGRVCDTYLLTQRVIEKEGGGPVPLILISTCHDDEKLVVRKKGGGKQRLFTAAAAAAATAVYVRRGRALVLPLLDGCNYFLLHSASPWPATGIPELLTGNHHEKLALLHHASRLKRRRFF